LTIGGAGGTFRSLRTHRNYRLFFAGQITSVCGTWMQTVALYWLVLSLTHSALAVGVLSFARFGPFTVFGLFAGVVADRFDNRKTVIATQSVQMAMSAVLAVLVIAGTARPWELCVIAALSGTAVVFDVPARQNLTMQLVGRDELSNAVALNSTLYNMARILGPVLAGVVIAELGAGWCFAINCASFLAVLAGLLAMRTRELYPLAGRGSPTMWNGVREGFVYVRRSRSLMVLIGMAALLMSLSFNFNVLLPVLAGETLGAGPRTFGALSACFGAGALVGALVSATMARARWRVLFAASCGAGIAELTVGPLHSLVAIGALLAVWGACFTLFTANSNTTIQLASPDHIRGRVLGIYFYALMGPVPLAAPFLGWLCSVGGTELAFEVAGASALAVTALGVFALTRPRDEASSRKPVAI
jgi:MFS family permease